MQPSTTLMHMQNTARPTLQPLPNTTAVFLVRGGAQELREGQQRPRSVVIEFPTLEAAKACYDSPEYQAAKALRVPVSDIDLVIVEGFDI